MRRRRLFIALGALVVGVAAVAFWPGPKEPEYQGKKLSEWVIRASVERDKGNFSASYEATQQIGTNAIVGLQTANCVVHPIVGVVDPVVVAPAAEEAVAAGQLVIDSIAVRIIVAQQWRCQCQEVVGRFAFDINIIIWRRQ